MLYWDVVWYVSIGYICMGIFILFIEVMTDGEFLNDIVYDFPELDKWTGLMLLIVACIGAWPVVLLYRFTKRRK